MANFHCYIYLSETLTFQTSCMVKYCINYANGNADDTNSAQVFPEKNTVPISKMLIIALIMGYNKNL